MHIFRIFLALLLLAILIAMEPLMPTNHVDASDGAGLRLRGHVEKIAGIRHGVDDYHELEKRGEYIEACLRACGLPTKSQYLTFRGRKYRNIIATVRGSRPELQALVVGAHYDGYWRTPGADDNASGVAVLLETACALQRARPVRNVELVAFTLEEPQTFTHIFRRGSRHFARQARKKGMRYEGAVILECVGFTAHRQKGLFLSRIFGMGMPPAGDFLAVVGNRPSEGFMTSFLEVASRSAPMLTALGYAAPAQGYLLPQLRFSDHASFWEQDYRAIMLNDTVMFRNPNYHQCGDTPGTLDYLFMERVATAVAAFVSEYR